MACHFPVAIRDKNQVFHHVPCGKCGYCRLVRVRSWIFRLNHEANRHLTSHFVTLTYEKPPRTKSGLSTLRKRDIQLFFKRLRKHTDKEYKYYAVGEYGTKTRRPHYHIILFGASPEEIDRAWTGHSSDGVVNGHIWVDSVTDASIAYTAKYVDKGKIIPMWEGDDRLPEFSLMSKKMGLNYLTPQIAAYHRKSLSPFAVQNGYKIPLPRYFKDKIYGKVFQYDEKTDRNVLVADFTHLKSEMNKEFEQLNKQKYDKQVAAAGGEVEYIKYLHERLRAEKENRENLVKIKRDKI